MVNYNNRTSSSTYVSNFGYNTSMNESMCYGPNVSVSQFFNAVNTFTIDNPYNTDLSINIHIYTSEAIAIMYCGVKGVLFHI